MSIDIEAEYESLLQFLYMAPIGLLQCGMDGEILMVNPPCSQLLMPLAPDGELVNLFTALQNVAPDLRHRVEAFDQRYGMVCDAMLLHVEPGPATGQAVQTLSLTLLKLDDARLMAVLSNVTESVKRDRALRHSQAWLQVLVSGLTDYARASLDQHGTLIDWNAGIGRITGFDRAACVGQGYSMFYPPEDLVAGRATDRLDEAHRTGWSLEEGWRVRADGSRFWGSCLIAPLPAADDAAPHTFSLIIRDISEHREANEALRRSVSCDHLTGLTNRRAFFEAALVEMERWHRTPRPLSAVLIDADHFKRINDEHGHAAGDAVLRHLAAGLSANFRAVDMVARIGGEEFVALLPGTTLEGAEAVAQRLCETLAQQTVWVDGTAIRYTVSVGVATMECDVQDVNGLLQRADAAMYAAKAAGRNRAQRWDAGLRLPRGGAAEVMRQVGT